MERAHELFRHGYFATNYVSFAEKLAPAKFLFAVEMVDGLFELSRHDFELIREQRTIDTSESSLINEDSVVIELPIPQNKIVSYHANQLWTAALKEIMQQNMQEAIFEDGMETRTLADSSDMEGQITDTIYESTEHHLHLPLSRLAKDVKNHLNNGGVSIEDDDSGVVTFQRNDYTLDVSPAEDAQRDAQSVSEAATDFSEKLKVDTEEN